jgi:hypothetical protein
MKEFRSKNHYVPQLYLKSWVDDENKLCVYKILVSSENEHLWRKHSPASIAYYRNFYTQLLSGKESDEFERWLSENYESPAKHAIAKAINDKKLSISDWKVLIRFLACQDVRTPARLIEHINREPVDLEKILQDSIQQAIREIETDSVPSDHMTELDGELNKNFPLRFTAERDPDDNGLGVLKVESYIGRATWIHSMKHILSNLEPLLLTHKWSIIKPAKGYSWPTSDNPVIRLNFRDDKDYDFLGGWGREKGNIFFPLGPQHAMFTQIGDKPPIKGTRLDERSTLEVRKFIAENAHRMIFCNFNDDEISTLRPRVVDPNAVTKENLKLSEWHQENKTLEFEFL